MTTNALAGHNYAVLAPQFEEANKRYEKGERAFPVAARIFYEMKRGTAWLDSGIKHWRAFVKHWDWNLPMPTAWGVARAGHPVP